MPNIYSNLVGPLNCQILFKIPHILYCFIGSCVMLFVAGLRSLTQQYLDLRRKAPIFFVHVNVIGAYICSAVYRGFMSSVVLILHLCPT